MSGVDPLLVITHDGAGNADALDPALDVLRAATEVTVAETGDEESLERALDSAGPSRVVVVAGGDGSLHTVVAALHRRGELSGSSLGLLPLGTGNDFARTLGLPLEAEAAAEALLSGVRRQMDLVVDDRDRVVVNNVHVGTGAQAGRHGATWKERLGPFGLGLLGYPIGALRTALKPDVLRLRVEADGAVVEPGRPVLMVAVGNGASVGGGAEITPGADPADGRVDVMVSYAIGPWARVWYAVDVLRARHPERDDVRTLRARTVTVSGEDFWVSADGELEGPVSRRAWRVVPAAYSLIVPA